MKRAVLKAGAIMALCPAWPLAAGAQDAPAASASTAAPMHGMSMPAHDMHASKHDKDAQTGKHASVPSQSDMSGMNMDSMQGGSAPPDARDPDYSDGISFSPDRDAHMHGTDTFGMLRVDRLEYFNGAGGHGTALEAQAWYGGDIDRATFKLEGEHGGGQLRESRSEVLWTHAVSAYWDTQLGLRHDDGEGPGRNWAAFGLQGLAPYWFELDATAYVGPFGRTAARIEAEYEVWFTQRLILTPKLEVNAYGKDDPARGIGSGISDASFGLRLRYEVRRQFAPYLGIKWERRFGSSADLSRRQGEAVLDRTWVAGVRIWL